MPSGPAGVSCYAPPPPTRSSSDVSYMLVSRAGRDAPLSAVSDMKGALGLVGVFLSFLLGELCGLPPLPSLSPSLPRSLPLSLAAANACSSAAHVGGAAVIVRVFLRGCMRARVDFADLTERFVSRRRCAGVSFNDFSIFPPSRCFRYSLWTDSSASQ